MYLNKASHQVRIHVVQLRFKLTQFPGMLATACRTILESLDRLPNADDRTKIALIGFDVALYFFCISVRSLPPVDSQ